MDGLSFSLHDLFVFLPVIAAGISFWVRLNRKQVLDDQLNKEQTAKLDELRGAVSKFEEKLKSECGSVRTDLEKLRADTSASRDHDLSEYDKKDRDLRSKLTAAHDRINILEKEQGELKGWKAAIVPKIDKI